MTSTTVYCAFIEEGGIASSALAIGKSRSHAHAFIVFDEIFMGLRQFRDVMRRAMTSLHLSPVGPKLLVVSAHGTPLTGTHLSVGNGEVADLWDFRDLFTVAPPTLTIYLSSCFGAYPSAKNLQGSIINCPWVVAPLVDIHPGHANSFQLELINILTEASSSDNPLKELVDKFNSRHLSSYDGRAAMALLDKSGFVHPPSSVGEYLASPMEARTHFQVMDLISQSGVSHPRLLIKAVHGELLECGLGNFPDYFHKPEKVVGVKFSAKFQLQSSIGGSRKRLALYKIRLVNSKS